MYPCSSSWENQKTKMCIQFCRKWKENWLLCWMVAIAMLGVGQVSVYLKGLMAQSCWILTQSRQTLRFCEKVECWWSLEPQTILESTILLSWMFQLDVAGRHEQPSAGKRESWCLHEYQGQLLLFICCIGELFVTLLVPITWYSLLGQAQISSSVGLVPICAKLGCIMILVHTEGCSSIQSPGFIYPSCVESHSWGDNHCPYHMNVTCFTMF